MSQDRELSANVHPLLAAAIIALVFGLFALRYEFDRLSLLQPIPTHVTTFANDQLAVVVDNRIFHGNEESELNVTLLEKMGVQEQIGAIGRFSNGDWLLRTGYRNNSLLQNVAIYLRLRPEPEQHGNGNGLLMRCNEATGSCSIFSKSLPVFDRTFGLAIAADDTVFIADTSEHRLLKIDASGDTVRESHEAFAFPNQLQFVGKDLWLANTNKHEIARIDTSDDNFGRKLETINLIDQGVSRAFEWPVSVTRVDDGWWILGKGNNLVGGAILRFDSTWRLRDSIALPEKSDPAFLHSWHGHVYVTDMEHRRVMVFDLQGSPVADLAWPTLTQLLDQSRENAAHYRRLSRLCVAGFIGVLLGGLSIIWLRARDLRPDVITAHSVTLNDATIQWIDITPSFKRQLWFLIVALVLGALLCGYAAFSLPTRDPMKFLAIIGSPLGMMGLMIFIFHRMLKQRIGVKGETLILVSANGAAAGVNDQILYSPQHVLIGDIAVSLGQPHKPLFPHKALVQQVYPRLKQARAISPGAMQMQLIRTANPLTLLLLASAIAIFFVTMVMIR